jgi:hypothetical protein
LVLMSARPVGARNSVLEILLDMLCFFLPFLGMCSSRLEADTASPTASPTITRSPTSLFNNGTGAAVGCPPRPPNPNSACTHPGASCLYGTECCCGECSYRYGCDCDADTRTFQCHSSDYCNLPYCGNNSAWGAGNCSAGLHCLDDVCCYD